MSHMPKVIPSIIFTLPCEAGPGGPGSEVDIDEQSRGVLTAPGPGRGC